MYYTDFNNGLFQNMSSSSENLVHCASVHYFYNEI